MMDDESIVFVDIIVWCCFFGTPNKCMLTVKSFAKIQRQINANTLIFTFTLNSVHTSAHLLLLWVHQLIVKMIDQFCTQFLRINFSRESTRSAK